MPEGASPSKLYLRVDSMESPQYAKTKNLVEIFDGSVRVYFYDRATSSYHEYDGGIEITEFVLKELVRLLGRENVVLK